MIGVALAFLAPWIIALTAFIGIGARGSAVRAAIASNDAACLPRPITPATTIIGQARRLPACSKATYHSLLEMFMGRKIIQARNALRILP